MKTLMVLLLLLAGCGRREQDGIDLKPGETATVTGTVDMTEPMTSNFVISTDWITKGTVCYSDGVVFPAREAVCYAEDEANGKDAFWVLGSLKEENAKLKTRLFQLEHPAPQTKSSANINSNKQDGGFLNCKLSRWVWTEGGNMPECSNDGGNTWVQVAVLPTSGPAIATKPGSIANSGMIGTITVHDGTAVIENGYSGALVVPPCSDVEATRRAGICQNAVK